ncbi:hypothetical protein [Colwellia sp. 12G3]|uniref:hypothetical protein n=1 Tax=Colwellia sp. 12G3 TaxID=2058299 RepID=UPI0012FF0826|nr:hypothetical protein [Colwellia sp. 12G3]
MDVDCMSFKQVLIGSLISLCITGCAYQPSIATKQPYCKREPFTNKLTLKVTEMEDMEMCDDGDFGGCVVALALIGPLSFIVSGSVVLIGNTLYWSEYQLSC